jgi:hypothetical protein
LVAAHPTGNASGATAAFALPERQALRRRDRSPAGREPLELIRGSLSSRRIERQAPWLAGLHRAADGTLAALGCCMLAMSALTLHWQNQWGTSFQRMEDAQVLAHRLQESAALLEQHHLVAIGRPGLLVPTSSEKLVHLPSPPPAQPPLAAPLMARVSLRQIPAGY